MSNLSKNRIKDITIGSDPEMFLYSIKEQKYVPVCGLVGGTKDKPKPISDNGHFIQEDNVAVEFCIPPCETSEEFINNINFVKNYLQTNILDEKSLILKCISSTRFEYDDLQSEQAQLFGCEADYNAYTFQENIIDKEKIDPLLRSAGFHIHIGYKEPDVYVSIDLVRAFDLFVLVPSILMDPDIERRQLYGNPGAYRLKKYGVECRGLGAFFVENEERIEWVFKQTMKAIEFVNEGGIITNEQDIQECIKSSDKDLAYEIMDDYKIEVLNYEKA